MMSQEINKAAEADWTEVITPKVKWFDLRLGDVWRYRDLLGLFVKRDFVAQYRQTILGPLWHIIQPIFTTIMYLFVFNHIAKISTDVLPAPIFYMSSVAIWNFFTSCLNSTSATFTANAGIFGKVYFPRLISPIATVLSSFIKFSIQFTLLAVVVAYYVISGQFELHAGWNLALFPVIALSVALMGLGGGIIISSLTTKYRDLNILIGFGISLLMYITPVIYPMSFLENSPYKAIVELNPLASLIEGFRYSLFGSGDFSLLSFVYSLVFILFVILAGIVFFNRVERSFMDTV